MQEASASIRESFLYVMECEGVLPIRDSSSVMSVGVSFWISSVWGCFHSWWTNGFFLLSTGVERFFVFCLGGLGLSSRLDAHVRTWLSFVGSW